MWRSILIQPGIPTATVHPPEIPGEDSLASGGSNGRHMDAVKMRLSPKPGGGKDRGCGSASFQVRPNHTT